MSTPNRPFLGPNNVNLSLPRSVVPTLLPQLWLQTKKAALRRNRIYAPLDVIYAL